MVAPISGEENEFQSEAVVKWVAACSGRHALRTARGVNKFVETPAMLLDAIHPPHVAQHILW